MPSGDDAGVMITVADGGGLGYAGTSDLSPDGLRRAMTRARDWAARERGAHELSRHGTPSSLQGGTYRTPVAIPWDTVPLHDKIDLLRTQSERLHTDPRIVDWDASLWHVETETLYLTADGTRVHQTLNHLVPGPGAAPPTMARRP